jgi:hypothetical protein
VANQSETDDAYWFGESIAIFDFKGPIVDQSTVLMSHNRHDVDISKIVAYEILMNEMVKEEDEK